MTTPTGVGTLREKPLHASLKRWYGEPGDLVEEPIDGFVIDLVRGDQLIEIQTRGFSSMKRKLAALLGDHHVRIVHPIARDRWIVKVSEDGEVLSRRRSPKHGVAADLFGELVSFPRLVADPRLTIEVVLTQEEELRRFDGRKGWRRGGWVVEERRLLEVVDRVVIETVGDLAALLPDDLAGDFTTADLAASSGRPRRLAQQMAYCLREVGAIEPVGKSGNAVVYRRPG